MVDKKILTLHPLGKNGKNISKNTYDLFKKEITSILKGKELTHSELFENIEKSLKGKFLGNISWYTETVKLDLAARKIIERTRDKPQKYKFK